MICSNADLRTRLAEARAADPTCRVALISTVGALHAGHAALIARARADADLVVVSTFVNPLRFANAEAAAAYPSRPERDERMLADLDVDILFAPAEAEILPAGLDTERVSAGPVGLQHEGQLRPFYFDGLLTLELALFQLIAPDVVVYGNRDRQRVFLVTRMVAERNLPITVLTAETVRTDDGLPVSSRVALLEEADRHAASQLPVALEAAASNADRGVDACIAAAQASMMGQSRIDLEYLTVVDPATFLPVDGDFRGRALALIAATVGGHRFIDNEDIYIP